VGRPRQSDKVVVPDYSEGIQIKTADDDPRFNNALARALLGRQDAFELVTFKSAADMPSVFQDWALAPA